MQLTEALKLVKDELDKPDNGILRDGTNGIFLADAVEAIYDDALYTQDRAENLKDELDYANYEIDRLERNVSRLESLINSCGSEKMVKILEELSA